MISNLINKTSLKITKFNQEFDRVILMETYTLIKCFLIIK